jgi:exosortase
MRDLSVRDRGFLVLFIALSAWLWLRDRGWVSAAGDTLPILAGLPLFIYLGSPWQRRQEPRSLAPTRLVATALLLLIGFSLEANVLLALSMALLADTYLESCLEPTSLRQARALLPLIVLAYPWLVLDGQPLTWWFRITGATVTAHFFSALGLAVSQEGVQLMIQGLQVSVDPACAGLNVLQAALLAGMAIAVRNERVQTLRETLPALAVLFALAWLANVARIILLCVIALTLGTTLARGPLHSSGGLLVLLIMFVLTLKLFARRRETKPSKEAPR